MLRRFVSGLLKVFGLRLIAYQAPLSNGLEARYRDIEDSFVPHHKMVSPYTETSIERQYNLYQAIKHIARQNIKGAIVECGVYKGGSSMMAALAIQDSGKELRDIWLYDTYAGMTAPSEVDIKTRGHFDLTIKNFNKNQKETHNEWCYASLESVQAAMAITGYPSDKIHYIEGDVMKTIPKQIPDQIALLRLDTDFYDSTKHELEHLYKLIVPGGILIVDDYGGWEGARKAVDEFWQQLPSAPFLVRIDDTGRLAIKN